MTMLAVNLTKCCGVAELSEISSLRTPQDVLKAMLKSWRELDWGEKPLITFTGVVGPRNVRYPTHADRDDNYGGALADFIVGNKLGTITASPVVRNTNGNSLQIWVWAVDWDALIRWDESTEANAAA